MKRALLFALLAAFCCGPAHAGNAGAGNITSILTVANTDSVLFSHSGSRTGTPACATNFPARWTVPAGTSMGQAQLAVLLTAYSQQKQISIVGTGNCYRHPDTETVLYIQIID